MYLKGGTLHQHQEKAVAGGINVWVFSVCSAIAFLNHHNHAASEQQAKRTSLSLSAWKSGCCGPFLPVHCLSLPRRTVCSQSYSYKSLCWVCLSPRHPCNSVCGAVTCFDTPFPFPLGCSCWFPCRSLLLAQCRALPCRQPADTSVAPAVTSGSVTPTRRPRGVALGEVLCSLLLTCMEEQL